MDQALTSSSHVMKLKGWIEEGDLLLFDLCFVYEIFTNLILYI